ncbi:Alpha/Beta hydrolase protein, partial [Pseudomassariella vexata]
PLILIHDGGGTTFSYHCLEPTNRPLYGIQNAHLDDGGWWEGGIPEMASHYIDLISAAMPTGGDILLGGWSLGGILSLEMAHQLATNTSRKPKFRVLGMVFVDSVFPKRLADIPDLQNVLPTGRVTKSPAELKAMKLREKVDLNMTHARVMVQKWDVPQWNGLQVPPTVMLRAKEYVSHSGHTFVDLTRQHQLLGWETYNDSHGNFIRAVLDVEGHHFSIFHHENVRISTHKLMAHC